MCAGKPKICVTCFAVIVTLFLRWSETLTHNISDVCLYVGFPGDTAVKNLPANGGDAKDLLGFHPQMGKTPWSRIWQPTPVSLPRKYHGQRSLVGYSPWGCKELVTTEHTHTHMPAFTWIFVISCLFLFKMFMFPHSSKTFTFPNSSF